MRIEDSRLALLSDLLQPVTLGPERPTLLQWFAMYLARLFAR
jgi:hypothetical protein